ncbi:MAG: TerB family tellurite resistance protein [Pseudomonadota bacterium]
MNDFVPKASAETTAACGAYLLVALADARVAAIEEARFLGGVVNDPAFRQFDTPSLAGEYNRLLAALRENWNAAEAEILAAATSVKSNKAALNAIKVAARQAVIADQLIKPQEELVLARIARALGLGVEDL